MMPDVVIERAKIFLLDGDLTDSCDLLSTHDL